MRYLMLLILPLLACACNKSEDKIKFADYGPVCGLRNNSGTLMLCIEYKIGTSPTFPDTQCPIEMGNYSSDGAVGYATSDGGVGCNPSSIVGKCTFSGRKIFYYSSEFTSGGGQSDCTSLGGTFQ